jgi:hypothetical protein
MLGGCEPVMVVLEKVVLWPCSVASRLCKNASASVCSDERRRRCTKESSATARRLRGEVACSEERAIIHDVSWAATPTSNTNEQQKTIIQVDGRVLQGKVYRIDSVGLEAQRHTGKNLDLEARSHVGGGEPNEVCGKAIDVPYAVS